MFIITVDYLSVTSKPLSILIIISIGLGNLYGLAAIGTWFNI